MNERLLLSCLDGSRTGLPHACDGIRGCAAELYQQARRNRAGPSESSPAMHRDRRSFAQQSAQLGAASLPAFFEALVGRPHVADWKMPPAHRQRLELAGQGPDAENIELVILDETHESPGSPVAKAHERYGDRPFEPRTRAQADAPGVSGRLHEIDSIGHRIAVCATIERVLLLCKGRPLGQNRT